MKIKILLCLLLFWCSFLGAQTQPSWVQIGEKELSQAAITRLGSSTMTLLFNRPVTITEDITIPSNVKLKFDCRGSLNIATGKTLTINSSIDAPHIQIFTGAGTVTCTRRTEATAGSQRFSGSIKPAWWGAKNDGIYPMSGADGMAGTGTDSSAAFRAAALFAYNANAAFPENGGMSVCPIECEPGAAYLVTGDNVIGVATSSTHWVNYTVNGNGCSFYWTPDLATDTFIGNGHLLKNAHFKDFAVWVHGYTGARGIFWDGSAYWTGSDWSTGCQRNSFENLQIGKARDNTPTTTTRLSKVFYNTGYELGDRLEVSHCLIRDADVFLYVENPEGVSIKFRNTTFSNQTDNAVFFNFLANYGGFSVSDCDLLMKGNNQTLIKTDQTQTLLGLYDPSALSMWNQEFHITASRLETPAISTYSYTLADAGFGKIFIDSLNCSNGGGGAPASSYIAKIASAGAVIFRDCPRLLGKIRISPRSTAVLAYQSPIGVLVENCGINIYNDGGPEILVDGTTYDAKAAIQAAKTYKLPAVVIRNLCAAGESALNEIQGTVWQFFNAPLERNANTFRLGQQNISSPNGYTYLWDATATYSVVLPPYSIITKLNVTMAPTSLYGCSVTIGSYYAEVPHRTASGSNGWTVEYPLISTESVGIYIASSTTQRTIQFNGLTGASTATSTKSPAWATMEIRGISNLYDIPTTSATASQEIH